MGFKVNLFTKFGFKGQFIYQIRVLSNLINQFCVLRSIYLTISGFKVNIFIKFGFSIYSTNSELKVNLFIITGVIYNYVNAAIYIFDDCDVIVTGNDLYTSHII